MPVVPVVTSREEFRVPEDRPVAKDGQKLQGVVGTAPAPFFQQRVSTVMQASQTAWPDKATLQSASAADAPPGGPEPVLPSAITAPAAAGGAIARRLLFWFLVIALIPCALLTALTTGITSSALEQAVRDNLVRIAASKARELEAYASECIREGRVLSRSPAVIQAARELGAIRGTETAPEAAKLRASLEQAREFTAFLDHAARELGYAHCLLLDAAGRVVFTQNDAIPLGTSMVTLGPAAASLARGFDRARGLLQTELGGFQPLGEGGRPVAFVTSPVIDQGNVVGVLALGIGPQRIWEALSDLSGLGDTGEIVTGERQGDNLLVTAPLRHEVDAAFRKQIPFGSTRATATQRAANGEQGYGKAIDYRGHDVVAAWQIGRAHV